MIAKTFTTDNNMQIVVMLPENPTKSYLRFFYKQDEQIVERTHLYYNPTIKQAAFDAMSTAKAVYICKD